MKVRILIASAALGLSMSAAAMAATSITPSNKCQLYARDLSQDIMLIQLSGNVDAANQALAQGKDECARGKYDQGITTLTDAIKALNLPVNEY
jgi:hypothetical protein